MLAAFPPSWVAEKFEGWYTGRTKSYSAAGMDRTGDSWKASRVAAAVANTEDDLTLVMDLIKMQT